MGKGTIYAHEAYWGWDYLDVDNKDSAEDIVRRIADLGKLSSAEYEEKYGKDAECDPYVIAKNALESIRTNDQEI